MCDMKKQLKLAFELIERGRKETELREEYKNVILILGGTGAGKSTFTQWVTGKDSKLIAKEIARGEYLIDDGDRIGMSTINSKTYFPELVVDTAHNTAFYDCPGFGDSRSISNDLATICLVKKVVDYADGVKLIFIIRHSSVRKGVDKTDFMELMKYVSNLVIDINKFKNSIALMITKVDNLIVKQGENFTLLEDESVIADIADFLFEVKQNLQDILQNEVHEETMCYKNAIKIIDILITKSKESLLRLGLFRRPDESGTLDKITFYQKAKKNIQRIIFKSLDFTETFVGDFGYGLSEKCKNDVIHIFKETRDEVWFNLGRTTLEVEKYFSSLDHDTHRKIRLFLTETENIDADLEEAKVFLSKFRKGSLIIEELVKRITEVRDLEQIVLMTIDGISQLGVVVTPEIISRMMDQVAYLKFLQTICEKELNTKPGEKIFKDILLFFRKSQKYLKNIVEIALEKTNDQIKNTLTTLTKTIEEDYDKNILLFDVQDLPHVLNKEKDIWFSKIEKIKHLTTIKELLEIFYENRSLMNVNITRESLIKIEGIAKYIPYLAVLSNKKIKMATSPWLNTVQDIIKYLNDCESWYKFLFDLYDKFSQYIIQKEKHLYNVEKMEEWGKSLKTKGIIINSENFASFLEKISHYSIAECTTVKKIKLSDMKLQELNHILSLTLKSKAIVQFTETMLKIHGDCISLKNIFSNESNAYIENGNNSLETLLASRKLKTVIVAANTIFIDRDLDLVGRQVTVIFMAQKWEIIGSRKIDLRGKKGKKRTGYNEAYYDETEEKFFDFREKILEDKYRSLLVDGRKKSPGQTNQYNEDRKNSEKETVVITPHSGEIFASIIGGAAYAVTNVFGAAINPNFHEPNISQTISSSLIVNESKREEQCQEKGNGGKRDYPGKLANLKKDRIIKSKIYHSRAGSYKANDGEPGIPGGPGGNFFGLGEKFVNGKNLSIFVDGGKGGPGQKGQDGEDGKDAKGKTVEIPPNPVVAVASVVGCVISAPLYILKAAANPFDHTAIAPPIAGFGSTITIGKQGEKGQDGGDGGKGGEGGLPGTIALLEIGSSSGIITSSKMGSPGEDGAGGRGGKSGMNAPGPIAVGSSEYISSGRDSSARDGRTGSNSRRLKPKFPRKAYDEFSNAINEYERFLEGNIKDRFKKHFLSEFQQTLNTSKHWH